LKRECERGVRILRINAPNFYGSSVISRGLVQILAPPVLGLRAALGGRHDVIYTVTPPIMIGLAARRVAQVHRVPWVANVQDLFPQCMVDLGILRGRRMIRMFERMERTLYRTATAITVMSEGNRQFVIGRGGDPDRVHVAPNWVDTASFAPGGPRGSFRHEHGLGDAFLVVFAGTMGFSQGLDVVIEAARLTQGEEGLIWLMVGGGAERGRLAAAADGLTNVRFLPMQPKEKYPSVLADADICLVTLRPEVATPTVPSKIGTIMAAGRPLIASIPATGDAKRMIEESGGGVVVPPADARALAEAVVALKQDRDALARMGNSGRAYAEKHLSRESCVTLVENVLKRVTGAAIPRP
ncbi:MAG: glycosyltransferase family 4 protein, partial [Armatimonadetes bacterium]|nr:glycosyltransferase family 4 protein [Armatimonadota bacterium]